MVRRAAIIRSFCHKCKIGNEKLGRVIFENHFHNGGCPPRRIAIDFKSIRFVDRGIRGDDLASSFW